MSANIQDFSPSTEYELVQTLVNLMPTGKMWDALNIEDSNFRKLLKGLSIEFGRAEALIYTLASQFLPTRGNRFVDSWETFLGIPDDCFNTSGSIETRALQIMIKLGSLNLFTKEDYYHLADLLGIVLSGFDNSTFGTIIITMQGLTPDNIFNMDFDPLNDPTYGAFIFGSPSARLYQCLVEHYKPAYIDVQFIEI
jgi:uncharacterized protein YmfQ (DUF2313 family)